MIPIYGYRMTDNSSFSVRYDLQFPMQFLFLYFVVFCCIIFNIVSELLYLSALSSNNGKLTSLKYIRD